MIIYGLATKHYDGTYYSKREYKSEPLEYFDVIIFGFNYSYINFLLFFIITLGVGIYLLIYNNDQSIKNAVKKPKLFDKIKSKYSAFETKSLPKQEQTELTETTEETRIAKVPTAVNLITLLALFFTFYLGVTSGFTLWFFIILSYYYYITLRPKTKKSLILKAIGYPLIFWILFSIILSEDIYSSRFTYMLSKNFIPFLISVIVIYFSQIRRFGNPPHFNKKSPLFWISVLCLIVSIVRFGVQKYIESSLN